MEQKTQIIHYKFLTFLPFYIQLLPLNLRMSSVVVMCEDYQVEESNRLLNLCSRNLLLANVLYYV